MVGLGVGLGLGRGEMNEYAQVDLSKMGRTRINTQV